MVCTIHRCYGIFEIKILRKILLVFIAFSPILSLPVTKTSTKKPAEDPDPKGLEHNLEYERYLKEIVTALESDSDFRKKLDEASEDDIRSGNIANELDYVNHQVRTKLDELKREEIERLRALATQQFKLSNGIDDNHLKISQLAHLDHENVHTFEIEDLKRLILKTSEDLGAADKARREDFKQYELQKEFEKQQKIHNLEESKRIEYEAELERQRQKHNKHEKVHHPGNKEQLEEVWEKQDHMEGVDFNPQTFFMMHDLDSNGVWDQYEVKALFVKELDKVYQQGLPEDDMRERAEEMERMREHVFNEADRNKDGLIDYQEFIEQTKRDEYQKDPGWETVDQEKVYTHDEYLEFERRRQEEIQRLIAEHPEKYPQYQQYQQYQQVPQQHQNQHLDQQHLNQQQQYQNQQNMNQHQGQPSQQNQHFDQQHLNQQQNSNQHQGQPSQQNQHFDQQHLNQQQNSNQHQGQPSQQNQHFDQQHLNQQQQPPPVVPQQQIPVQQKPISNSPSANQLNSNQVNSKSQNSVEQKQPSHGQEPQVLH